MFGFGDIFGGGRVSGHGRDLGYEIEIGFKEAAFGTQVPLKVERAETCSTCNGSGPHLVQILRNAPPARARARFPEPTDSSASALPAPVAMARGK